MTTEPAALTEAQIDEIEQYANYLNKQRASKSPLASSAIALCRLARLGLRASDPKWKLVPVEITQEMLDEVDRVRALSENYVREVWQAAVAAAPSPEPGR